MSQQKNILTNNWVVLLGALFCCALWGSAFPCIKIGYEMMQIDSADTASQILYAGYRFTLAGILTILFGSIIQKKPLVPKKTTWGKIGKLSLFQTVIQYVLFYVGLAHTTGVKASIIEGVNVFVAILVAGILFRLEKVTARKMLGCLIGFAGVVLVNLTGTGWNLQLSFFGEGFIFLSTVSYAFSTVIMKRYSKEENPVLLSGYQFVMGGIFMVICGLLAGGTVQGFDGKAILMLIYLAFISAGAYSVWGILLKYNPVSKVAVYGFMNPVIGVLLSAILLNEKDMLGYLSMIALVLVCVGIYIVNWERKK